MSLALVVGASACDGSRGVLLRREGSPNGPDASGGALNGAGGGSGASGAGGIAGTDGSVFRPSSDASFQIQLSGTIDTTISADFYVLDLEAIASTRSQLSAQGRRIVCHFSAGTLENFRGDADAFPSQAIGNSVDNYPDERWLDIRNAEVVALMRARIQRAKSVGCDGIQPANVAGYLNDTGFTLTETDQLNYNRTLANAARELQLSIGLTDGNQNLAQGLVGDFDWAMAFDCWSVGCPLAATFISAEKPGFVVEFDQSRASEICAELSAIGAKAIIKNRSLDAFRQACDSP